MANGMIKVSSVLAFSAMMALGGSALAAPPAASAAPAAPAAKAAAVTPVKAVAPAAAAAKPITQTNNVRADSLPTKPASDTALTGTGSSYGTTTTTTPSYGSGSAYGTTQPQLKFGKDMPEPSAAQKAVGGVVIVGMGLGMLAFGIVLLSSLWKIFKKAGEPGWASLIPFYNQIVLAKIINKPIWWLFVPPMPIVLAFALPFGLARKFGKGTGFGFGLLLMPFIFYPVLGLGSAKYDATA